MSDTETKPKQTDNLLFECQVMASVKRWLQNSKFDVPLGALVRAYSSQYLEKHGAPMTFNEGFAHASHVSWMVQEHLMALLPETWED